MRDHELRYVLNDELHGRPGLPVTAPARVTHLAFTIGEGDGDPLTHVKVLCDTLGVKPPAEGAPHHWAEIAGEDMARITRPVKVGYGREGMGASLTLLTTGAVAPMVEMQKERLRERVNAAYGYAAISRILLTQTAASGFAEGQAEFSPAPKAPPPPDPALLAKAAESAAPVKDPDLRAALETMAQNILTRRNSKEGA